MIVFRSNYQILLLVCLLFSGCGQNKVDNTGDIPVIDIIGNLGNYEGVPVSRYITELEYIPLETNDNCLFADENWELLLTSTHIFVQGGRYCYAFDRNGRFLGQIGSLGQGPGEFNYLTGFTIDENNQVLYLETYRTLLKYSWDGVFHQSIKLPENIHGIPLCDNFFVRDNLFLGHFRNHKGDFLHNFALYNQSSEVIKSFDNYVQFNPKVLVTGWVNRCMKPYRIGEHIYVKEISNDTLFYLNERNGLIPHFVFDLGKYTITKEMRESREPSNLYSVNGQINLPTSMPMIDTQNNLFFSFSAYNLSGKYSFPKKMNRSIVTPSSSGLIIFQGGGTIIDSHAVLGVYDTTNQTTQLLDTDPVTQIIGLINDLDGGLSFWPQYYTSENELVDIWRVEDMKEHLTDEYFAGHEIKDPAAHQKLKELVQKLDIEDNPVIVIAKLKPN